MNLNERVEEVLKAEAVDLIGFADLSAYRDDLVATGGPLVDGFGHGISVGLALPAAIVDRLPERADPNVACAYKNHCYDVVNQRLNLIASKLASFLCAAGYAAVPIAASERTNEKEAAGPVSHKMVAHIAGLGWIGKSCLLVTEQFGPRVRFVTVLTNAPLCSVDDQLEQRCGSCTECVKICPVGAFKGKNYISGEARSARFDFQKCHDYFEELKTKSKWPVCGMCLYVCPHGRKRVIFPFIDPAKREC